MWAFVPCCSTKKPKQQQIPQPKPILPPQIHVDNASQHNTVPNNLDTIMNSAKGKNGQDFGKALFVKISLLNFSFSRKWAKRSRHFNPFYG